MVPSPLAVVSALTVGFVALGVAGQDPPSVRSSDDVDFARDVKPILDARCVECHGPAKQKGGLRLDRGASALARITPGKSAESALVARLRAADADERMPQGGPALDEATIRRLERWIDGGAPWPAEHDSKAEARAHWAYRTLTRPTPPSPRSARPAAHPIDAFVEARLEEAGLAPNPRADRVTELRRVTLDLTGLPPTLAEVDLYVADSSPDAYAKVVDRLLGTVAHGERMAQWWLDLARFADTNGYEKDARRTAWPWRDWVVRAFVEGMPFDEFGTKQIAGDLWPSATRDDRVATGFARNTLVNEEGGTDPEEFRDAAVVDRTNTVASVFLGSTLACAQCHDHKFDPFSQREYYSLYAFFDNTTDVGNKIEPVLATPTPEEQRLDAELATRIAASARELTGDDPKLDAEERAWSAAVSESLPPEPRWTVFQPSAARARNGTRLETREDGSLVASGAVPERETYTVEGTLGAGTHRVLQIEALADPSLPTAGPGRAANGNFVLSDVVLEVERGGRFERIAFGAAEADLEQAHGGRFRAALAVDGDTSSGWAIESESRATDPCRARFLLEFPLRLEAAARARLELAFQSPFAEHSLGAFRVSLTDDEELARWIAPPRLDAWRVVGPFPAENQTAGFLADYPPEAEIARNGDLSARYASGDVAWRSMPEWRDGDVHALPGENAVHYLERRVACEEPTAIRVFVGADDALKLWIDGRSLLVAAQMRGGVPDQHVVEVELARGDHRVALKVVNGSGPGAFFFQADRRTRQRMPDTVVAALRRPEAAREPQQRAAVRRFWRETFSPRCKAAVDAIARDQAALDRLRAQVATTPVLEERATRRTTRVHRKGSYLSPGEEVSPDVPAVLGALASDLPRDRLTLARWIFSRENPITARVIANRLWERLFGRGIVATTDDFGTRGDPPSHPELLDWLAAELRDSRWDWKHLLRTIVTSETYRRSSHVTAASLERDPEGVLLARAPRPRLEIETLRDVALAASGLLDRTVGGPSVMPPQPDGVWAPVYSEDTWTTARGADRYRRGLYVFWRRSSPYATYTLFDAPSRELSCTRRARTNTPLQALALLNDPAFVECAEALARRARAEAGPDDSSRVARLFALATARAPEPEERDVLLRLLASERARVARSAAGAAAGDEVEARDVRAWTSLANVVLNLDETVTRN